MLDEQSGIWIMYHSIDVMLVMLFLSCICVIQYISLCLCGGGCWLAIEEQDANFSGFNLVTDCSYYNILIITNRFAFHSLCSGDGGAVAYALVSGSDRKFEVDVSTGLVTTVDYLDYETKTTYLMNVSATDQSPPFHQGFCTVYVTLLNELDEAVAFFSAGYEASLRENIATGTEVVQVQAQSADNLNQLTYRFDPDTSPAALALFKIDSVTVSRGVGELSTLSFPYVTEGCLEKWNPIFKKKSMPPISTGQIYLQPSTALWPMS